MKRASGKKQWLTYSPVILGVLLHNARVALGLSIRRVSSETGISTSQILRIESGEFDARLSTLVKLAPALGVPVGLLIDTSLFVDSLESARKLRGAILSPILESLPPESRKKPSTLQRVVSHCAFAATICVFLVRASNPVRVASGFKYPTDQMKDAITHFARSIDGFGSADRLAVERELVADPIEVLIRWKIISQSIVADLVLRKREFSCPLEPNRAHIIGSDSPLPEDFELSI